MASPSAGGGPPTNLGVPVLPLIELVISYAAGKHECVVTTICGALPGELAHNPHADRVVELEYPNDTFVHTARGKTKSILIADLGHNKFHRFHLAYERLELMAGTGDLSFKCGIAETSEFFGAHSICVHPKFWNMYYLCDAYSVRELDVPTSDSDVPSGVVTLVAGSDRKGRRDGVGSAAESDELRSIVCTGDGETLFVCDGMNGRIRGINTRTRVVTSVVGTGVSNSTSQRKGEPNYLRFPIGLTFDRNPNAGPAESVLWIATEKCLMRYDRNTDVLSELKGMSRGPMYCPSAVVSLPSGYLLFTCTYRHALFAADSSTGAITALAGAASGYSNGGALSAQFNGPVGLSIDDDECCAYIADTGNNAIRKVAALPPYLFAT